MLAEECKLSSNLQANLFPFSPLPFTIRTKSLVSVGDDGKTASTKCRPRASRRSRRDDSKFLRPWQTRRRLCVTTWKKYSYRSKKKANNNMWVEWHSLLQVWIKDYPQIDYSKKLFHLCAHCTSCTVQRCNIFSEDTQRRSSETSTRLVNQ